MSMKCMITAAAVLAALAVPALAGDHDLETELRDSGRYVPQVNLPDARLSGAYASAGRPVRAFVPRISAPTRAYDFQLDGR